MLSTLRVGWGNTAAIAALALLPLMAVAQDALRSEPDRAVIAVNNLADASRLSQAAKPAIKNAEVPL